MWRLHIQFSMAKYFQYYYGLYLLWQNSQLEDQQVNHTLLWEICFWISEIITQNRKAQGKEIKNECASHGYNRPSSHLIYLSQFTVVVHHGGRESLRPVNCCTDLSPHSWGGNRGPSKAGWGHFLCLQALAVGKKKNKMSPFGQYRIISNTAAAFLRGPCGHGWQMSSFGVITVNSFSLSLCHPQSSTTSVMETPNRRCFFFFFYSKCESAARYAKGDWETKREGV